MHEVVWMISVAFAEDTLEDPTDRRSLEYLANARNPSHDVVANRVDSCVGIRLESASIRPVCIVQ